MISQKNPIDKKVLIDMCEEILDNSESIINTVDTILTDFLIERRNTIFDVNQRHWIWIFSYEASTFEFMSGKIFNELIQLESCFHINEGIIDIDLFNLSKYTKIEADIQGRLDYLNALASGIVYINEQEYLDLVNNLDESKSWVSETYKNRLTNSLDSILKVGKINLVRPMECYC